MNKNLATNIAGYEKPVLDVFEVELESSINVVIQSVPGPGTSEEETDDFD